MLLLSGREILKLMSSLETATLVWPIALPRWFHRAHFMTDQLPTYKAIGKEYAAHEAINHGSKEFCRAMFMSTRLSPSMPFSKEPNWGYSTI